MRGTARRWRSARVGVEARAHLGALVFPATFVRTHGLRRVDRHERAVGGERARGEERRVPVGQPDLERVAHLEVLHHRRARQALVVRHARAVRRGRGSALGRALALRPDVVQLGEGLVVREERRRRVVRRIDLVEAEGVARGVELLAQLLLEGVVLLVRLHRGGAAAAELGRAELLVRLARARLLLLLLLRRDHGCVGLWFGPAMDVCQVRSHKSALGVGSKMPTLPSGLCTVLLGLCERGAGLGGGALAGGRALRLRGVATRQRDLGGQNLAQSSDERLRKVAPLQPVMFRGYPPTAPRSVVGAGLSAVCSCRRRWRMRCPRPSWRSSRHGRRSFTSRPYPRTLPSPPSAQSSSASPSA